MLNMVKEQLEMYKKTLVTLCNEYPQNDEYYKTFYIGKVDGVIDLLSFDYTLTIEEYVKVARDLKESFEREVNEMLK